MSAEVATTTEQPSITTPPPFDGLKRAYLQDFSLRHLGELKALGCVGNLLGIENRDWRNSAEHTLAAGAYAELLARSLGIPEEEVEIIGSAAVLHDLDKREESELLNKYTDPSEALRAIDARTEQFHADLIARGISENVIRLSKANLPTSPAGPKTLAEKIIWCVDIMLSDTQPELVEQRIAKFEQGWNGRTQSFDSDRQKRNQLLNEAYRARFHGKTLTEVQRGIAASIEKEFAEKLGFTDNPTLLPFHLKRLLHEDILQWGISRNMVPETKGLPVTPEMAFGLELTDKIRKAILPVFGIRQVDVPVGKISHDFQYAVDEKAEEAIKKEFEVLWKKGIWYGYATEEQGLVLPPGHEARLIYLIDPVDGSRPAQAGMETACITMAIVDGRKQNPTFSDITAGITQVIKEHRTFIAQKGAGVYEVANGNLTMVTPREHPPTTLDAVFMAYENYGVREKFLGAILDDLRGKTQSSSIYVAASFGLLSLVRGQNDVYIDLRTRLLKAHPNASLKPNPKCLQPYDIAAPWIILQELGGMATDAYGKPFNEHPLWIFEPDGSWSIKGDISMVAAVTPQLHAKALETLATGFSKL